MTYIHVLVHKFLDIYIRSYVILTNSIEKNRAFNNG